MLLTYNDQLFIGPANWRQLIAGKSGMRLVFNQREVGQYWADALDPDVEQQLGACMQLAPVAGVTGVAPFFELWNWLKYLKQELPSVIDWGGFYFRQSYLYPGLGPVNDQHEELLLGPFIGERTEHWKIPLLRGLCGLAIRENRTVNAADVNADSRHIACSLKTKSELVIPLHDPSGRAVAELDLDSNTLAAFTPDVEAKVRRALSVLQLPARIAR